MDEIRSYVRQEKTRHPIGVLVAFKHDRKIHIGFSQANTKAGDKFDKKHGVELALGRAFHCHENDGAIMEHATREICKQLPHFVERCQKAFKGAKLPDWTLT